MAKTITIPYILLLLLLVATTTAEPQGPGWMLPPDNSSALAPSPGGSECFSALLGTSDCLTFVGPKSNLTKPDPGCCPQITNLMKTKPVCLCKLVGNPDSIGLTVDRNRALKLPAACNITTPPRLHLASVQLLVLRYLYPPQVQHPPLKKQIMDCLQQASFL